MCLSLCVHVAQLACVRVVELLSVRSLETLAATGAVSPLIALLASPHRAGSELPFRILNALCKMAGEGTRLREQMLQAGALPVLRELARQPEATAHLLSAVSALQLAEERAALILDMPHACARLLSDDPSASTAAVVSLRKLLSFDRPPISQIVDTPGVVERLVQLMRDSPLQTVQVSAARRRTLSSQRRAQMEIDADVWSHCELPLAVLSMRVHGR